MKASRWSRYRPALARKNRLVSFAIERRIIALDVGRQRHVTDGIDRPIERRSVVRPQPNQAAPEKAALDHFTMHHDRAFEDDLHARFELLAGMHQRFPDFTGFFGRRARWLFIA